MNKVRLSGIAYESLVNGPGMRRVFFAQGCRHNCKGCFNPETHDFNGGELMDIKSLVEDVEENPLLKGITFSGGDPMEQADKFGYMAKKFKEMGLNTWCYTGYRFEFIKEDKVKYGFLKYIDVLVDGKFEEELADESLKYRGSSNQRIIDVKSSLENNKVELLAI
ncbi:anaerobic ribonucleoside-triphosphate reductase activating protein [uncultured Clostridium sp.]|jgi:anaerobic ribonucleoside-triphosphate reductase activating protein|uniref:anaerobic ribonucleoside-triphosphate reductase activating protein n=1 Tax=uncultured Clostridium sp. TaxID=59620 RepID=UPI00260D6C83|nr:anaerobic ribonucleoside-triphosphate reductase activating protein [uncultured Clostridium sp.]